MEEEPPDPDLTLAAFGIRARSTAIAPVGGAWSNRVFRVDAGDQSFAAKELRSPSADQNWAAWLAEAWSFEQAALAAGVAAPRPVPNPADGSCLAWVSRRSPASPNVSSRSPASAKVGRHAPAFPAAVPVRLHHWTRGQPISPGPVRREVACWVGQVLAVLHGLNIRPRDRALFPVLSTGTADRWPELAAAAHRAGAPWAGQLTAVTPVVALIADLARSAGHQPAEEVMSHGDIDQKNLIATSRGPVLCDWDLAVPLVPRRELADVALSMAGWEATNIARDVVRSYRKAGGDDTAIESADLAPSLMSGLDWAAFNVERAIGQRQASPAETALARQLVPGLLADMPRELSVALRVRATLEI